MLASRDVLHSQPMNKSSGTLKQAFDGPPDSMVHIVSSPEMAHMEDTAHHLPEEVTVRRLSAEMYNSTAKAVDADTGHHFTKSSISHTASPLSSNASLFVSLPAAASSSIKQEVCDNPSDSDGGASVSLAPINSKEKSSATKTSSVKPSLATIAPASASCSAYLDDPCMLRIRQEEPGKKQASKEVKKTDDEGRVRKGKLFKCTGFGSCNMCFSRSEHLARHIRKHTGERPFQCRCGRSFSRLDNLRQHVYTVHADEPQNYQTIRQNFSTDSRRATVMPPRSMQQSHHEPDAAVTQHSLGGRAPNGVSETQYTNPAGFFAPIAPKSAGHIYLQPRRSASRAPGSGSKSQTSQMPRSAPHSALQPLQPQQSQQISQPLVQQAHLQQSQYQPLVSQQSVPPLSAAGQQVQQQVQYAYSKDGGAVQQYPTVVYITDPGASQVGSVSPLVYMQPSYQVMPPYVPGTPTSANGNGAPPALQQLTPILLNQFPSPSPQYSIQGSPQIMHLTSQP